MFFTLQCKILCKFIQYSQSECRKAVAYAYGITANFPMCFELIVRVAISSIALYRIVAGERA